MWQKLFFCSFAQGTLGLSFYFNLNRTFAPFSPMYKSWREIPPSTPWNNSPWMGGISHAPLIDSKPNVPSFPRESGPLIPIPQPWPLNINGISKPTLHVPQRTGNLCLQDPHKCFPEVWPDMVFTGHVKSTDHVKSPLLTLTDERGRGDIF